VADFGLLNIYQLKPTSDEVRAISMHPCRSQSLTLNPSINGFYTTCDEEISNTDRYQYRIHKRTFDGRINSVIYNAPQGKNNTIVQGGPKKLEPA